MRYVYGRIGDDWEITIFAADTQETDALRIDAQAIGAELIVAKDSIVSFLGSIVRILARGHYDLIQSHGFISAVFVCIANYLFHLPHVLTVHGILEGRLLQGPLGKLKFMAVKRTVLAVDAVYGVSEDILEHLRNLIPDLRKSEEMQVAILNGIETKMFLNQEEAPNKLRSRYQISEITFLFGFLGRFMPQKGFEKIIEALVLLKNNNMVSKYNYRVLAVGSGDYKDWYIQLAWEYGVAEKIIFIPFQRDMVEVYQALDAVIMPSKWEACPLQPMEALVSGLPLITSDCIGLREVVRDTPALIVSGGKPEGLAQNMERLLKKNNPEVFEAYRCIASRRFNIAHTVGKLRMFFDYIITQSKH